MKKFMLSLTTAGLFLSVMSQSILAQEESQVEEVTQTQGQPVTSSKPVEETQTPTQAPTQAPTTQAPTTQALTTQAPTTQAPTTQEPTTEKLTTSEATTIVSSEKKEETTQNPAPQNPGSRAPVVILPPNRTPSHNPDDYKVVTPETTTQAPRTDKDQSTEAPVEKKEEINLLDGNYIAFNANVFESEEEADDFIKKLEEDDNTEDRFQAEKESLEDGLFLVRVTYKEDLPYIYDQVGQSILFYVATAFDTKEEAETYMEENLHTFPDVFFQGEVLEVDGKFDVIFGLQTQADTQAVTYNEESFEIEYLTDREDFFYYVYQDESGNFTDPIPAVLEEKFPGMFEFETEDVSDSKQKVHVTVLEQASTEEETSPEETTEEVTIEETSHEG